MQEILVVVAIAAAIFFIPRLVGKKPMPEALPLNPKVVTPLTGRLRLAILSTVLWIAGSAAFLKPWEGNGFLFVCITLGPILIIWGGVWVWIGFKKYRR